MIVNIVCLFLVFIPLCGPLQISPFICIRDLWITKEFLALLAIITICIIPSPRRQHTVNPWIKSMLVFLIFSIYLAPPIKLLLGPADLGGLWMWKSLAWVMAYFMFYRKIKSMPVLRSEDKMMIANAIGYAGFISAVYAIFQYLNLDQFQTYFRPEWEAHRQAGEITALIGSPVYLGVFLGLCLPFSIYCLRWWQNLIIILAILACQSDTANLFTLLTLIFMFCMKAKNINWLRFYLFCGVLAMAIVGSFWHQIRPHIHDNGRFAVWRETFNDWHSTCLNIPVTPEMTKGEKIETEFLNKRTWSLTGRGLGSFEYIFQRKHPGWNDPHNIYLKVLYETGIIGFGIFLGIISFVFWRNFSIAREDSWTLTLYCSFLFACLSGATLPILIIEPLRFIFVVILSFL